MGVPPSGAWDDRSFTLANRAVGNPPGAAGLEAVLRGPVLRFTVPTTICVTGAATSSTVDGTPSAPGKYVELRAERDILLLISNCPQINNPCNGYDPTPISLTDFAP